VETYILYALARRSRGERRAALDAMLVAVETAAPMGAVRRFVRRGEPVLELLEELREERRDQFLERLVYVVRRSTERGGRAEGALSPRELEILRLMAEGRTAEEAADRLCVAPSTVRSHVKAIYSKLGAHRRIEAIRRARELGLL
jgi:LuxR family maltose regulon positive regulatory protein